VVKKIEIKRITNRYRTYVFFNRMTTLLSASGEMDQYEAVATSLVAMVPTGFMGTLVNAAQGNVQFKVGMLLSLSSSIAMYTTARYLTPQIEVCILFMTL